MNIIEETLWGGAMLAHRYKIWGGSTGWGDGLNAGRPDLLKHHAGITVVAKRHATNTYEVFNELVCMQLGRSLGLPIPVGFVLDHDGHPWYCSADVAAAGGEFPDADFEHLATHQARLMCGIALFDGWVCNVDRHARNLYYDTEGAVVQLIDHGAGVLNRLGASYLRDSDSTLILDDDFASEIRDLSSFDDWYERLLAIPQYMITDTVMQAAEVGVDETEAREAGELLNQRRAKLRALFRDNLTQFPKYSRDLFAFGEYDDPTDLSN